MTLYVYDAAYEPNLTDVKANGGIAIARYFVGTNSGYQWKRVTPQQVQQIRAAGLGVVVNYEGTADPIGTAKSQGIPLRLFGQNEAKAALVDIQACGVPQDGTVACYFSLDNSYGPANFADAQELFRGHNDVMGPARIQVKAYGDGLVCRQLIATGLVVGKQWLAAPSSWPGFDPNDDADFCMVQLVGSPVSGTDQDIVHSVLDAKAIGAFWPAGSPYDPPAPGVFMALTDQQQTDLYNAVIALKGVVNDAHTVTRNYTHDVVGAAAITAAQNVWSTPLTGLDPNSGANAGDRLARLSDRGYDIDPTLGSLNAELAKLVLDPAKLAAAVVAALPAPSSGGLTKDDVVAAVKTALTGATITPTP